MPLHTSRNPISEAFGCIMAVLITSTILKRIIIIGATGYAIIFDLILPFLFIFIKTDSHQSEEKKPVKITRLVSRSKVPVTTSTLLHAEDNNMEI